MSCIRQQEYSLPPVLGSDGSNKIKIIFGRNIVVVFLLICAHLRTRYEMKRTEYFSKVIKVITELTDVTEEQILGKSRIPEVVDARWMVIYFLKRNHYSTRQISELLNHPQRTINHAFEFLDTRAYNSQSGLGNNIAIAKQQLL